jgi:hypothetical protein
MAAAASLSWLIRAGWQPHAEKQERSAPYVR